MDKGKDLNFEIVLSLEYSALKEDVKRLRIELSALLSERDDLTLQICPRIEAEYLSAIGALEKKVYETECEYRRIKRKAEMVVAKINREERIDLQEIESALDAEFVHFEEVINEYLKKVLDAIDYKNAMVPMSEEESVQFKKLYRSIIKKIHPDILAEATEEQRRLFGSAVTAYENGDLKTLKTIAELVDMLSPDLPDDDSITSLKNEKDRLSRLVQDLKEEIEKIKGSYPYNLIEYVENEEKMKQRRSDYNRELKEYDRAIKEYTQKLRELLKGQ